MHISRGSRIGNQGFSKRAGRHLSGLCLAAFAATLGAAPRHDDTADLREKPVASAEDASPPGIKLYAIDCGRVEMADTDFLADDGSMKNKPGSSVVPCFLIRHPDGDLMWDTGLPDTMADKPSAPGAAMRFHLGHTLGEKLKRIDLQPSDVEYVSFSHLHFDHAGNGNLFSQSTWIVDKAELEGAFSESAKSRGESIHYDTLASAKKIVIDANSPYDVFGDGTAVIHRAPGHTPGHSILLLKTAKSGAVLLTGDLWILPESRERKLVPIYNASRAQTLQSMTSTEALAEKTGARIIRQHVPEDFDSLPKFPAALE